MIYEILPNPLSNALCTASPAPAAFQLSRKEIDGVGHAKVGSCADHCMRSSRNLMFVREEEERETR